nr:MAG TPA: hypothetical protein [Caudoviricetes sp.]
MSRPCDRAPTHNGSSPREAGTAATTGGTIARGRSHGDQRQQVPLQGASVQRQPIGPCNVVQILHQRRHIRLGQRGRDALRRPGQRAGAVQVFERVGPVDLHRVRVIGALPVHHHCVGPFGPPGRPCGLQRFVRAAGRGQ